MKNIKSLILAIIIATSLTPKKSEAVVALFTGNGALALYGLGSAVVGPVMFVGGVADIDSKFSLPLIWGGTLAFIGGIIMLDGADEQLIEFHPISTQEALQLEITEKQRLSFNNELDQANIVLEEVSLELEHIENATTADAKAIWANYKEFISPESFSVMEKIGDRISN